jgi:hypothetical protein
VMVGRARVRLPRKMTSLRAIEVGPRKRTVAAGKPHFANLGEAVAALRRSNRR